jgi:transcription elongation GreA/GreB family factor
VSRAFVREDDVGDAEALPERPQSGHPNYITPNGLHALERRFAELAERRAGLAADMAQDEARRQMDRDLRWLKARIERAIIVEPSEGKPEAVTFGTEATVRDDTGKKAAYVLVGEDEAEPANRRVSWTSPLGRALMGAKPGDWVTWPRPAGDVELEVVSIRYPRAKETLP